MPFERADRLLVARGLFESRASARAAIEAAQVKADGRIVSRPAQKLPIDAELTAQPAHPYVSRGGVKLAHALDVFAVDPTDRICLDIGASTGGFTDVLLRRGAARVICVDVGHGQLHASLRNHPGVLNLEGADARTLSPADLPARPDLIVCDASFISLSKLLGPPLSCAAPNADLIALFKPQFEVGRGNVGRGGIVRNAAASDAAAEAVAGWLESAGWPVRGWTDSPIQGGAGNQERLLHAKRQA